MRREKPALNFKYMTEEIKQTNNPAPAATPVSTGAPFKAAGAAFGKDAPQGGFKKGGARGGGRRSYDKPRNEF